MIQIVPKSALDAVTSNPSSPFGEYICCPSQGQSAAVTCNADGIIQSQTCPDNLPVCDIFRNSPFICVSEDTINNNP